MMYPLAEKIRRPFYYDSRWRNVATQEQCDKIKKEVLALLAQLTKKVSCVELLAPIEICHVNEDLPFFHTVTHTLMCGSKGFFVSTTVTTLWMELAEMIFGKAVHTVLGGAKLTDEDLPGLVLWWEVEPAYVKEAIRKIS